MKKLIFLLFVLISHLANAQSGANYCNTYTPMGTTLLISGQSNKTYRLDSINLAGQNIVGISIVNCSNLHITKMRVLNGKSYGIRIASSSNITVDSCYVSNVATGIYATMSSNITIKNNYVFQMVGPASSGMGSSIQLNTVTGTNIIANNNCENLIGVGTNPNPEIGDMINMYLSSHVTVANNYIRGGGTLTLSGGRCGILVGDKGGDYQEVYGNKLINTGWGGIQMVGGSHHNIHDNDVFSANLPWASSGINIANFNGVPSTDITVANNRISWISGYFGGNRLRDTVWQRGSGLNTVTRPINWNTNLVYPATASLITAAIIPTNMAGASCAVAPIKQPLNPIQLTTNTEYIEPSTNARWVYNGITYKWTKRVDSVFVMGKLAPYALDANTLHKTGNENKTGNLTVIGELGVGNGSIYSKYLQGSINLFAPNYYYGVSSQQFKFTNQDTSIVYHKFQASPTVNIVTGNPTQYNSYLRTSNPPVVGNDIVNLTYYNAHLPTSVNIYNSDGTLTGDRALTRNGHSLTLGEGSFPQLILNDSFGKLIYDDGSINNHVQVTSAGAAMVSGSFFNNSSVGVLPNRVTLGVISPSISGIDLVAGDAIKVINDNHEGMVYAFGTDTSAYSDSTLVTKYYVLKHAGSGTTGSVTSLTDNTANGVAITWATRTTTPVPTVVLGAITPTSVNGTTSTEIARLSGVTSSVQTQLNAKQATLTFDSTPTSSSTNPVTSGGVFTALAGKQATGNYIVGLNGDGTATGPGTVALTLATVNSNVGTFGSPTQVPVFVVNAKGLITGVTNTSIQIAESQVTSLTSDLALKLNITDTTSLARKTGNVAMQQASYAAIGTGGNGFLSFLSQSVSPSRVSGILKLYRDSVGSISYMNGLVRRTLKFTKNGDITTSFPYKLVSVLADSTDVAASITGLSSTYVPLTRTVNGKALSSNIILGLASSDFANQGTTTSLLHGNASGNPSFGQASLTADVSGILPVGNGGTGVGTLGVLTLGRGLNGTSYTPAGNTTVTLDTSQNYTWGKVQTIVKNSLGTTTQDALILKNTDAAVFNGQQITPSIRFSSFGWNTTTSTSQLSEYRINSLPTQSTAVGGAFQIQFSTNGGAFTTPFSMSSGGTLSLTGAVNSNRSSIVTTVTDGISTVNSSTTSSGTQIQYTGSVSAQSQGWNPTAAASQIVKWEQHGEPLSTNPISGNYVWGVFLNGGAESKLMYLGSNGQLTLPVFYTTKGMLANTAGGAITSFADGTANQVLGMNNGATGYEYKTVIGSAMITVSHSANAITLTGNPTGLITGTPTIVAGTGAGTSPTVSVTTNGKQLQVTVTTGTLPTGTNATIATVTLPNALTYTPLPVFSSASAATALLNGASMIYMSSTGTANVTITSGTTALTAATTYVWNIAL